MKRRAVMVVIECSGSKAGQTTISLPAKLSAAAGARPSGSRASTFTANPTFGTETGPAFAGQDLFLEQILVPTAIATNGGVAISALDDVEIDAGIEDVEVELSQEQEDIDQSNEAEQRGLYYGEGEGGYWGPAWLRPRRPLAPSMWSRPGRWSPAR